MSGGGWTSGWVVGGVSWLRSALRWGAPSACGLVRVGVGVGWRLRPFEVAGGLPFGCWFFWCACGLVVAVCSVRVLGCACCVTVSVGRGLRSACFRALLPCALSPFSGVSSSLGLFLAFSPPPVLWCLVSGPLRPLGVPCLRFGVRWVWAFGGARAGFAGWALVSRWSVPSRLFTCKPFHRKKKLLPC